MADLGQQLADVITAGLAARPDLRQSLAESLASDTYTKAEANYREADDGSNERCGTCNHFDAGSCDIVSGRIDPEYVCDYFDGAGESSRPANGGDRPRADRRNDGDGAPE